jgi:hypothetical protein
MYTNVSMVKSPEPIGVSADTVIPDVELKYVLHPVPYGVKFDARASPATVKLKLLVLESRTTVLADTAEADNNSVVNLKYGSLTVIVTVNVLGESCNCASVARTVKVYSVSLATPETVPDITPVFEFKDNPGGNDPDVRV